MPPTREDILSEIRRFVSSHGGEIPGARTFASATRIKDSSWKGRYWVRWTDAVREAGYDPNARTRKIPDEEILQKLGAFVTVLGHFPVRHEINLHARSVPDFPVWQTVRSRYGGIPQTAAALLESARITENAALAQICEARLELEKLKPVPAVKTQNNNTQMGFVYLKYSPSLRLYKIGKANNPNKRGAGISLLLPEDLIPKHEIKTDCPYILEKYWENRFLAKKKQGEWYDLNSIDVEAFKARRQFMFSEFFP